MTKWNAWFISVKYVVEYLDDVVNFFGQEEEGSSAMTFFKNCPKKALVSSNKIFHVEVSCQEFLEGYLAFQTHVVYCQKAMKNVEVTDVYCWVYQVNKFVKKSVSVLPYPHLMLTSMLFWDTDIFCQTYGKI
ncbi:hypothetical protein PR048_012998 [Dryococelus australis]|uniref:Uncharacterized protein n=1 Tax=Dryococelus australis TaxID=614101 RepID=A0ABQ9HQY8_9NEOP|nr:hypothetical protein PR048_012998 [Dryococelus australis]